MTFNWMYALCVLIGVAVGMEILYMVMKYRVDHVAEEIRGINDRMRESWETNNRLLKKWDETVMTLTEVVDFNGRLIDQLEKAEKNRKGKS